MKRARHSQRVAFWAVILLAVLPQAWCQAAAQDAGKPLVNTGYLEHVTFERLPGRERVVLKVSKETSVSVENQPGSAVLVRLDNLFVPAELRRPLSASGLANVVQITPQQRTAGDRVWVLAIIDLKQKVPYSVMQVGTNVLIDFNVASLASATTGEAKPSPTPAEPARSVSPPPPAAPEKPASGPRISLDVQDADIKAVFRLLSEYAQVSIVSGDDVKGMLSVHLRDVPWDQALDTILRIKGLGQQRDGNVITVMTLEKMKKDEADRVAVQKQREADRLAVQKKEDEDKLREPQITRVVPIAYNDPEELKKNIEEILKSQTITGPKPAADGKAAPSPASVSASGSVTVDKHTRSLIIKATRRDMDTVLRFIERIDKPTEQISIKANIVETTKDTARNLGIQWGGAFGRYLGNQSLYVTPGGTGGSSVPPGSALSGAYNPTSGVTGMSGQGYDVSFPAGAILGTAPASLGLLFGTIGGNILDVQLSALQNDGKLRILSSPSLRTQDNQMASTEHGEEIPVVTPATSTNPATVSFKKAVLRLEITPHVIDGKNIRMTLLVRKDEADFTRQVQGNPPLFVKETKTDLVVADGETIVISGLTKQRTREDVKGVPWFKEVPVLGWLFKGESTGETMEEVLIFITPSIIKSQITTGIQEGI